MSDTEIALTWEAVEDALSYNIYSADTLVANVTELTYTVTGLTAETEYSFVVKAVNEVGESEASNVATATTLVPAPTFADYRLESVATSWGNTAYTYDEENANTVVSIDEDGLITEVTYNEAGQIASAVATVEEVDEEGNPVETVISGVEYEYDENGVWTSFTETLQGWFGGVYSTTTELGYNAEGQLVSLTSEELVRTIAYNEAGLISEVMEGSVVVEEDEEEDDDEIVEPDGVEPLSEAEVDPRLHQRRVHPRSCFSEDPPGQVPQGSGGVSHHPQHPHDLCHHAVRFQRLPGHCPGEGRRHQLHFRLSEHRIPSRNGP